jgi:hypothetical protein
VDFTAVRFLQGGKLEILPLVKLRNTAAHSFARKNEELQLIICDELKGMAHLGFRIPDVLQASLARGGVLLTQPHDVIVNAYLDFSTRLVFVGSVNRNYVDSISQFLETVFRTPMEFVEISGRALVSLVLKNAVAFYGAEVQNDDGERLVVQRRIDFDQVLGEPGNRLLSVTITPQVESPELFMFTLKSRGTFHVNCGSLGELLHVFGLVVEAAHNV